MINKIYVERERDNQMTRVSRLNFEMHIFDSIHKHNELFEMNAYEIELNHDNVSIKTLRDLIYVEIEIDFDDRAYYTIELIDAITYQTFFNVYEYEHDSRSIHNVESNDSI